jgi:HPt (histidine-containing phosphotransfer) domain-containing protein
MSPAAAIDSPTLRALQDTAGTEFVSELAATFLEDAPRMLADLRSAFEASDAERFRRAAHSLKSNALTFGALPLAARARALEVGGVASVRTQGGDPVGELEAEYARAAAALEASTRA